MPPGCAKYTPGVSVEFPWPESPARVERRVRGIVESLLRPDELEEIRLEWVTPEAGTLRFSPRGWVVLRLTVLAMNDEGGQWEIWGPEWPQFWEGTLLQLANDLEDWVCETSFGWGQERVATVPS